MILNIIKHPANVYSQSGEDGILLKILETLPETDKWCVEFGAADGILFSNTRNLILNHNYSAILIEGNKKAYKKLSENYRPFRNVLCMNNIVGFQRNQKLDHILSESIVEMENRIPLDFDFLSMDVDGNEYHIWESLELFKPKVVCIEYNPSIPTEVEFVQPADVNVMQGSSLKSIVDLGKKKGYELVCVLMDNAIFVKKEYYHLFNIIDNSPYKLRKDVSQVMYMFIGFDGHIFLRGCMELPRHWITLKESQFQILPKYLQKWSANYGLMEKVVFAFYLLHRNPKALWKVWIDK